MDWLVTAAGRFLLLEVFDIGKLRVVRGFEDETWISMACRFLRRTGLCV